MAEGDVKSDAIDVHADCTEQFMQLKRRRRHRWVLFTIDDKSIVVDRVGERSSGPDAFVAALPFQGCRYAVYDHELRTDDGRLTSKLLFFTWLPRAAPTKQRMLFTYGKKQIRAACDGVVDVNVQTEEEVKDALGVSEGGGDVSSDAGSEFDD